MKKRSSGRLPKCLGVLGTWEMRHGNVGRTKRLNWLLESWYSDLIPINFIVHWTWLLSVMPHEPVAVISTVPRFCCEGMLISIMQTWVSRS